MWNQFGRHIQSADFLIWKILRGREKQRTHSTFNTDVFKDCPLQHKLMKIETSHLHFLKQQLREKLHIQPSTKNCLHNPPPDTTSTHLCVLHSAPHPCAAQHAGAAQAAGPLTVAERASGQSYYCSCPAPYEYSLT